MVFFDNRSLLAGLITLNWLSVSREIGGFDRPLLVLDQHINEPLCILKRGNILFRETFSEKLQEQALRRPSLTELPHRGLLFGSCGD